MRRLTFAAGSLVLLVIGLFIVFSSVSWGSAAANAYLRSHGGGMDSTQFGIIMQESINMYQWIGGVLAALAGIAFVRAVELR